MKKADRQQAMKENISLTEGHNFFAALCKIPVSDLNKIMRIVVSFCLLFVLIGCNKEVSVSECIDAKTNEFKKEVLCPNAAVKEYSFQGGFVYVFSIGDCPDAGAAVWDIHCNFLGSLNGFGANTKINGVDFETNANYKRTIWHR